MASKKFESTRHACLPCIASWLRPRYGGTRLPAPIAPTHHLSLILHDVSCAQVIASAVIVSMNWHTACDKNLQCLSAWLGLDVQWLIVCDVRCSVGPVLYCTSYSLG